MVSAGMVLIVRGCWICFFAVGSSSVCLVYSSVHGCGSAAGLVVEGVEVVANRGFLVYLYLGVRWRVKGRIAD